MGFLDNLSFSNFLPGEKSFPGGIGINPAEIVQNLPISKFTSQIPNIPGVPNLLGPLGLGLGGTPTNAKRSVNPGAMVVRDQNGVPVQADWRVRLGFPSNLAARLYSQTLLYPLRQTDGVVFPYTPNISINYTADWQGQRLTQSNYTPLFYASSDVQDMTITGEFTAMNVAEARYLLAVITFCRLATKMFFGDSGDLTGNPPAILHLNGYGQHHFNNVPVVLKTANYQLPADVDYIDVGGVESIDRTDEYSGGTVDSGDGGLSGTRVPTQMVIAFTVQPIYSRRQVSQFNYEQFANGEMIQKGFI